MRMADIIGGNDGNTVTATAMAPSPISAQRRIRTDIPGSGNGIDLSQFATLVLRTHDAGGFPIKRAKERDVLKFIGGTVGVIFLIGLLVVVGILMLIF